MIADGNIIIYSAKTEYENLKQYSADWIANLTVIDPLAAAN
jgi:hypothetical protein